MTKRNEKDAKMIPRTPRGFRDVMPTEAAWRLALKEAVNERFKLWGYLPVETPALELLDVLEADGRLSSTPFRLFDADGQLLVLRPDVTLPVARMAALRLKGQKGPLRLCYSQPVFVENDSTYGQDRMVTQAGIEFIGASGAVADAEVLALLFETLSAAGLEGVTVCIGTVGVLNALVSTASNDAEWCRSIREAFHTCDFVELDTLCAEADIDDAHAQAIRDLARIRGGIEAIDRCRDLVEPLGCADGLDELQACFEIAGSTLEAGRLMVDFSIISSFDYYTGMVFKAYAPDIPAALASGGRYDSTLAAFGWEQPAAGFAIGLEPLMQALSLQGVAPPQVGPQETVEVVSIEAAGAEGTGDPVGGHSPDIAGAIAAFKRAADMRASGVRTVMGGVC